MPDGPHEGDGYLLTYVYDDHADASELVILDARAVDDGPVATVALPQRVLYGFHATWVPNEA